MSNLSVTKPYQKRRRYSRELKARIVAECLRPGVSVSRIALDNGLNANMVRRWMSEAQRAHESPSASPAFIPVSIPAKVTGTAKAGVQTSAIRIEIPRAGGSIVVEWPADQAHQCAALLRDLLG